MSATPPGLFVTGTGTAVGKTYVACLVAQAVMSTGKRVGPYKPVESGVDTSTATDSGLLAAAAGCEGQESQVCPQRFAAPLAPHLAARQEGAEVDEELLLSGIDYWRQRSDFVLVEGAGGLLSPISENLFVADLALELGYPLLVVAPNRLGVINDTLQTLVAAATFRDGLEVAGIVLNDVSRDDDPSRDSNRQELEARCVPPVLAQVGCGNGEFDRAIDWIAVSEALSDED